MDSIAVILPAAGASSRFGSDKLLANLSCKTVLSRALAAFETRTDVKQIVIAGRKVDGRTIDGPTKLTCVPGGRCRAESVLGALRAVDSSIEWVAIHDAARPLVSQQLIDRTLAEAKTHGAAAPAVPVSVTIKQAGGPLPSFVERTVPREQLWAMQTPQIARRTALISAFENCPLPLDQVTDDMQLLELAGQPVRLVTGDEWNIKITHPADLSCAEYWLAQTALSDRL